jgi:aryl-alcohol dehydrogenase-like predicted oxidoreductase
MLNAEVDRGRIRYFGGSNWTAERLAEANEYAAAQGMRGFVGSQPRWNLACEPEDPQGEKRLEPGVLLALSEGDAAWHESSQLPVMPYAPTANGYFATDGEKRSKTYDTDRGRKRLEVAKAVAQETGATTNQVAIAWLLHQPFPVFPILGTGRLDHLEDAIGATDVSLTDEQMQRLTC